MANRGTAREECGEAMSSETESETDSDKCRLMSKARRMIDQGLCKLKFKKRNVKIRLYSDSEIIFQNFNTYVYQDKDI